ncbi:MAG: hypothetical protein U1E49_20520 [Hyphomicrobiaceae bacterium]
MTTFAAQLDAYQARGWCRFAAGAALARWVDATLPDARATVSAPENAKWLRCGGTWFAGVNVLGNDARGAVPGGPALSGAVIDFIRDELGLTGFGWDPGQVSVCYPRYPQPMPYETEAAFRYRRDKDAAHLDGLIAVGPDRRRHFQEPHAFILGIPMVETSAGASPVTIYEGSHEMVRDAFAARFAGLLPERWPDEDVTEAYHAVRRRIFETCPRVEVHARPGEAYLIHRLALHGVARWQEGATAGPDGRMIVYFRPLLPELRAWLNRP